MYRWPKTTAQLLRRLENRLQDKTRAEIKKRPLTLRVLAKIIHRLIRDGGPAAWVRGYNRERQEIQKGAAQHRRTNPLLAADCQIVFNKLPQVKIERDPALLAHIAEVLHHFGKLPYRAVADICEAVAFPMPGIHAREALTTESLRDIIRQDRAHHPKHPFGLDSLSPGKYYYLGHPPQPSRLRPTPPPRSK